MCFISYFYGVCVTAVQFFRIKKLDLENEGINGAPVTVAFFECLNIKLKLCVYVN